MITYLIFFCLFCYSEIGNFEADITFFAERHDADTRQWLFDDFDKWFSDPGDSRAYVVVGDAGVGKSVMAGVLAQRTRKAGHLGAAYFCRHNDGTRNDPRYLLGTVACQLCDCNSQYNNIVGGEGGVRMILTNSKLGVLELFTKLLQEPLGKCTPCHQRKLVIIDALDETEYESREDFLDLLMHRFPLLPNWLVFFITSRPEDTVQIRLTKYHPCIKICAGNGEHANFYQQHEKDIQRFLEKRVDFALLPYSVEDVTKKCSGLFLYAFYIVKVLNDPVKNPVHSGKIDQLSVLFPGDIDNFFRENFQRMFDKMGGNLFRKLFGCVIAALSPLPLSFIPFVLKRENSDLNEQEVIDVVSQFLVLRTSDQTFTFLHNLIPSWLTDVDKVSRRLFIDRTKAGEYFRDIIVEFLPSAARSKKHPSIETDFVAYVLRVGVRFLCGYDEEDMLKIVFSCLTSYQFLQNRIQNSRIDIYSVIGDFKLSALCQSLGDEDKDILQKICTALESNIHVLLECPGLLPSCLRNAPKAVQRNVAIPDGVSTTWMESKWLSNCKMPSDLSCFALSPDKKLLAGGKEQCIYLFDACSLEKVLGPIKVVETRHDITHLAFSPDSKFVFFGRLDRWFSVERGCVEKFSQFAGNPRHYQWGYFTLDERYIAVKGQLGGGQNHRLSCLADVFCLWATQEVDQGHGNDVICSCHPERAIASLSLSFNYAVERHVVGGDDRLLDLASVLNRKQHNDWCRLLSKFYSFVRQREIRWAHYSVSLCRDCHDFNQKLRKLLRGRFRFRLNQASILSLVRQCILELNPEIFEYQVWDMKSGKPVLEDVFSSGAQLHPFFYLCHLTTALEYCEVLFSGIDRALSLCNIALINAVCYTYLSVINRVTLYPRPKNLDESFWLSSLFVTNAPIQFQNHFAEKRNTKLSLDGKWIAVKYGDDIKLFERKRKKHQLFDYGKPAYVISDVVDFAFANCSNALVYVTVDKSLRALYLQTGTILSSVSGLWPLYYAPKQVAYVFRAKDMERIICMRDFTICLLLHNLIPSHAAPVGVTFSPAGITLSLWSDATLTCSEITDDDGPFSFITDYSLRDPSQVNGVPHVKTCTFSQDGRLIATHQGTKILLFSEACFLCAVFEEEYDFNVSCLTFSADGTLLFYCIERTNTFARCYLWDVQKRKVSASFVARQLLSVDSGCLSSDKSKLIVCGELYVEIWEYAECTCCLLKKTGTGLALQ